MIRICKYCKTEYEGSPGSSACPDCVAKQRETSLRTRICRECGKEFLGGPRARYCPACRIERRRESDRRHQKKGTQRAIGSTDFCIACGKEYTVASGRQKYCPDCSKTEVRKTVNASALARSKKLTPAQRKEIRKEAAAEIPCVICGKLFVPTNAAKTCSKACSEALHKANFKKYELAHKQERNEYHKQLRKKAAEGE